jgi:hypothetical protein
MKAGRSQVDSQAAGLSEKKPLPLFFGWSSVSTVKQQLSILGAISGSAGLKGAGE